MTLSRHSHSVTLQTIISNINPVGLQLILLQFLDGDISASVTLMYLLIETRSLEKVSVVVNCLSTRVNTLEHSESRHRKLLKQLAELIRENHRGCGRITD